MRHADDRGATGVEYALIAGLIAVVALVGISFVGRSLSGSIEDSTQAIGAAVGAADPQADAENVPADVPADAPADEPADEPATGPVVVNVNGGGDTVAPASAQWRQSPGDASGQYEWVCANGFNLGNAKAKKKSSTPPGSAPSCG